MRRRDERFVDQAKYKALREPLYDKSAAETIAVAKFKPADFNYNAATNSCICPTGKKLYSTGEPLYDERRSTA